MTARLRVRLPDQKLLDAMEPYADVEFVVWDLTGPAPADGFDLLVPPYLLRETSSGRLRAALDVTDPEPLPADHPLWTVPGVLITPHVGGASSAMFPWMVRLNQKQISLLLAGEAPVNVVLGKESVAG